MKAALEKKACSLLDSIDYRGDDIGIIFAVNRVTQGNKRCGKRKEIVRNYSVSCSCPFGKGCGGD